MSTLSVSHVANIIQKIRVRTKIKNKNPTYSIVNSEKGLLLFEIRGINNIVVDVNGKPTTCMAFTLGDHIVLNTDLESKKEESNERD